MKLEDLTLDVEQRIDIKAAPEKVFAAVLERFGKKNTGPMASPWNCRLKPNPAAAGIATAATALDISGAFCRSSSRQACWS